MRVKLEPIESYRVIFSAESEQAFQDYLAGKITRREWGLIEEKPDAIRFERIVEDDGNFVEVEIPANRE